MTKTTKTTKTTKKNVAKFIAKKKAAAIKVGCPKCGHVHADGRNRACRSVDACKARRAA